MQEARYWSAERQENLKRESSQGVETIGQFVTINEGCGLVSDRERNVNAGRTLSGREIEPLRHKKPSARLVKGKGFRDAVIVKNVRKKHTVFNLQEDVMYASVSDELVADHLGESSVHLARHAVFDRHDIGQFGDWLTQ